MQSGDVAEWSARWAHIPEGCWFESRSHDHLLIIFKSVIIGCRANTSSFKELRAEESKKDPPKSSDATMYVVRWPYNCRKLKYL